MLNFILIGGSGYIAERHFNSIKKTNNNLIAVCDINPSIGKIDKYFPKCKFVYNIQQLSKIIKSEFKFTKIDYLVICTPNYLHFEHIKFGLKNKINVICEKPTVLKPKQINILKKLEQKYNKKVLTILQLRLHKDLIKFKKNYKKNYNQISKINLKYITHRGDWYFKSWKGEYRKSGGIVTNIGIHLFDILIWILGKPIEIKIDNFTEKKCSGKIFFENAIVNWLLSVDRNDLPRKIIKSNHSTLRVLEFNNKKIEFSNYFENLHDISYKKIINNKGFTLDEAYQSIELCDNINKIMLNNK